MAIPKKVAAMHDIAGFGRSSLTVVIPVMSALGHQTCPVPTAVLSTITGFYDNYTLTDLSDTLPSYLTHWEREKLFFDAVYTGFLGNARQADIAADFIMKTAAPLKVVDPVFADDGKVYECFGTDIIDAMKSLIKSADIITPNGTEAALLTDCACPPQNEREALECAAKLSEYGPRYVLVTSVPCGENRVSVVVYDKALKEAYKITNPYLSHAHYPGTGDLFTSVLTGSVLADGDVIRGACRAADFVFTSVKTACENKVPVREGVPLELVLPKLYEERGGKFEKIICERI